jgi:acyl transferase domain-containing protein
MSDVDYDAAIAVIGMAGRFPGANSVEELWDNLLAGRPGLRRLDDNELMAAGVSPAQLADPDYVRTTGSISDHDMFDAGMFGFNRREAEVMDPQHRIFLETTFAALENAGYPAMGMTDRVGLFAGCGFPDYMWNVAFETISEAGGALMMAIGNERDSLASLASYKLNLRGPSITVQTFCSTSLIAVHLAAQSLLNFECETALAGGVFIPLPQGVGYAYEEGGILSPDGTARAFDAAARGSVMGSGASVVVLKRLADAIADGDHITAVILGSATNNDGSACAGYTAPGVDGQAAVIADAISFAGIKPETISYVECHGTGTVLGDSIEVAAMARVFPDRTDDPVVLGSLKASIGHLDRAAGSCPRHRTTRPRTRPWRRPATRSRCSPRTVPGRRGRIPGGPG